MNGDREIASEATRESKWLQAAGELTVIEAPMQFHREHANEMRPFLDSSRQDLALSTFDVQLDEINKGKPGSSDQGLQRLRLGPPLS